jgi:hypothetical protein
MFAFAVAALIVSVIGSAVSYEQQRKAASVAADRSRREAELVKEKAADEADAYADNARRVLARQKANYAAAGFDTTSGSPLDVLRESAATAEKERQLILKYGQWSSDTAMMEADDYDVAAGNYKSSGLIATGGTLLEGSSNALGAYKKYGSGFGD